MMNNPKLIKVNFAGAEVLTREQLKKVTGGNASGCGTYPNCTTNSCVASSGPCQGQTGTCAKVTAAEACRCAVVCVGG